LTEYKLFVTSNNKLSKHVIQIPAIGVEEVVVATEAEAEAAEQIAMETIYNQGDIETVGAIEEVDVKPNVHAGINR